MAIPPIYNLIAKLLKANRRLKKANALHTRLDNVEKKAEQIGKRKYVHSAKWLANKQLKEAANVKGPVERAAMVRNAMRAYRAKPDPMPIKEQIALCAKHDELENRENTALADAYSLFNVLNNQIAALNASTAAKDIKERMGLLSKCSSVAMIIRQLDPKAMIGA